MGTQNKEQLKICTPPSVQLHRRVSILPTDYNILDNLPTINGVSLQGDLTAGALNLLSSNPEDFEDSTYNDAKEENCYVVLMRDGEKPKKVALNSLPMGAGSEGSFQTVEEFDTKAAVGSYQFVEKK